MHQKDGAGKIIFKILLWLSNWFLSFNILYTKMKTQLIGPE